MSLISRILRNGRTVEYHYNENLDGLEEHVITKDGVVKRETNTYVKNGRKIRIKFSAVSTNKTHEKHFDGKDLIADFSRVDGVIDGYTGQPRYKEKLISMENYGPSTYRKKIYDEDGNVVFDESYTNGNLHGPYVNLIR